MSAPSTLALLALLGAATLPAQTPTDRPAPATPARPPSRQDLDRREALKLYGLAMMRQRDNRLIEAVRTFEEAQRLDADSLEVRRALIPLYLALDRTDDALTACRQTVERDPADFQTWYVLARRLKAQGENREAADALSRGLQAPGLKDEPELRLQMSFDLGGLREQLGEHERAVAAFQDILKALEHPEPLLDLGKFTRAEIDQQALETYERLSQACVKAGKYEDARQALTRVQQRALAQEGGAARARRLDRQLVDIHLAQNHLDDALAALDAYLTTQPQGVEAYELKADVLKKLGRGADIIAALQRHCAADPHNNGLRLVLANQFAALGHHPQAEALYLTLAREAPSVDVYRGLFGFLRGQGRGGLERLLNQLNNALAGAAGTKPRRGRPGNEGNADDAATARLMLQVLRDDLDLVKALLPVVHGQLLFNDGLKYETRRYLAVLAARGRLLDSAEKLYRSCLDNLGDGGQQNEPEVWIGLLRVLTLAHKHEAIVEVCRRGLTQAQATNRTLFHYEMARALVQLRRFPEAVAAANDAVDVSGADDRLNCRCFRAEVLAHAERFPEAIADCQAMLKDFNLQSDTSRIRYALSAIYQMAKDNASAEKELQKILEAEPEDARANNNLGYLWAEQNRNLEEAERLIRKAIQADRKERNSGTAVSADADQENAAYVDSLGWVLFRRGLLKEARAELRKAAALPDGSDDPVVWDHLGDVAARLREPEAALSHYRKALELYDTVRSRPLDDRYREVKQKVQLLGRERTP